ncbi:MAG: biotin--[acetyl-CoA-carboxylase] ligase [Dehalogenimonas sp.]
MIELNQSNVERALEGHPWIKHILTYDCVGSTMNTARELAAVGSPEATIVVAARQTQGRGRLKRHWLSPEGSLSISILLYPPDEKLKLMTMMAGLALAHAVTATVSLKADIKWPNDLLIRGKKVAGILVESGFVVDKRFAVIGFGINVNLDTANFDEIANVATSLSREACSEIDPTCLLREIVTAMEGLYTEFDSPSIYSAWRERLITLGCRVRADTGVGIVDGIAEDVARDGTLIIRSDDSRRHNIIAGDVMLRHVN